MINLPQSLAVWGSPAFDATFKCEVERLDKDLLPLQQALTQSSHVGDDAVKVMVLHTAEVSGILRIKTGVFFSGVIAGCNCADDPTPVDAMTEYGELLFEIDVVTARATVALAPE